MLRLDLLDSRASGNKLFKLRPYIAAANRSRLSCLLSFGGPWSNHLHSLAALGAESGIQTVAVVRGDRVDTPMLEDAKGLGMVVIPVSRGEYRRRNDPDYQSRWAERFGRCLIIPEGGAGKAGVLGCRGIADLIAASVPAPCTVTLSVGTGTTLAGVVSGLPAGFDVLGVSALKGANDLDCRVRASLALVGCDEPGPWRILHDEHCGGFARVDEHLKRFMLAFESVHQVPLEPVYTGKMILAIHRRLASGELSPVRPILAVHSGGLQGRRGYSWLRDDVQR